MSKQYPVRTCPLADKEHRESARQYAHVYHKPGVICVARAFHRLPRRLKLALLLHEAGHLLAGPRGGEDAANRAAHKHTGVRVYYRDAGKYGEELEWIDPKDEGRAAEALGLQSGGMKRNPPEPPATYGPKFDRWWNRLTDAEREAYIDRQHEQKRAAKADWIREREAAGLKYTRNPATFVDNLREDAATRRRVKGWIRRTKKALAEHRAWLRAKGYEDDGVAKKMLRDLDFWESSLKAAGV